ncbi:hypothetical protein GCM10011613_16050 [Cellvibrio zantedeschiae]|uniref:Uncharacterized protein n=1 Tax=Cellvibrio zantedeschiae TaxID=1237077 RepID=A0ABQ3AZT9_9GAMM|nr:hypothetical protein [Cellvibrio zantedeschiae]GGY71933.1 hypothetical protein GCM10011613_16050 [Cellvibrio zantedeschiae]
METQFTRNTANDYRENVATTSLANNSLANASAVSWGAIFAGAAAAAALSLILLVLGTGLGFSSVSAWSDKGVSGTTFSVSTILWVTLTSLVASAIGGYIAGRLRNRWLATPSDEVYFRDTAHGFLAWAVATLATAALLTSVVSTIVGAGAQAGAKIVGGAAAASTAVAATTNKDPAEPTSLDATATPYFLDLLFRKDLNLATANGNAVPASPEPEPGTDASKAEVARIYINALSTGALPTEDARYAAQVVAQTTGLTQQDAEKRVTDVFKSLQTKLRNAETAAREAAEQARKATAYGSLWLFVSLLIGAFIASFTAIFGGRQRDL